MKRYLFLLLLFPILAQAQSWQSAGGNALQYKVIAPLDTIWAFNRGTPGLLAFNPHGGGGGGGTTTYPLTVNSSGAGDASSFIFNGAVARTLSYNSIGAQALLVSGTNIKTINSTSLLGSGNIAVQPALGFTPENIANKATSFGTLNNTLYPTTQAVANYVAANTFALTDGSGTTANGTAVDLGGTLASDAKIITGANQFYAGTSAFSGTYMQLLGASNVINLVASNTANGQLTLDGSGNASLSSLGGTNRIFNIGTTGYTISGLTSITPTLAIGVDGSGNFGTYSLAAGGTVTSLTDNTANGIAITWANRTTTPVPTVVLGAITPTSTNGVSAATMAFNDATSSIQTQLNGKQASGTYLTPSSTNVVTNKDLTSGTNTFPTTLALTTNPLSQFASTTSAQLAGVLSDESGTGVVAYTTNPVFTTPNLGTPSALVGTNITGAGSGFTAGHVTTNANLTGDVTSVGNASILVATTNSTLTTLSALSLPYSQLTGTPATGVSSVSNSDGTLTISPTTGAVVASIALTHANSWQNQTFTNSNNVLGGVTMTLGSDATGDTYYRNSSGFLNRLAIGGANTVLHGGTVPSYSAIVNGDITNSTIDLTAKVTGLLPLANGGTATATPSLASGTGTTVSGTWPAQSVNVGTSQNIATLSNLTSNGPVYTSGGVGTLNTGTTTGSGTVYVLATSPTISTTLQVNGSLTVQRTNIATTSADGPMLNNNQAATSGVPVQYSPRIRWSGFAWTGAASQQADWIMENEPVNGTSPITSNLVIKSQINSGGYTSRFSITDAGVVNISNLTASKVVFTDASKNLTSTGIGTANQLIAGDGSLVSSPADVVNTATDANYTVTTAGQLVKLPVVTANRTVSIPSASTYSGQKLTIWNQDTSGSFTWSFTGATVKDAASNSLTTLVNTSVYLLQSDGTNWVKTN